MNNPELILVVDDIPANLGVVSEALIAKGFEVAISTSGERALNLVKYTRPNLILLDVMMPGIDGFETCRHLQANPSTKDIPIIFMTALSDTIDKVKGLNLGAVDYISKPFQHEEVLARIKVHLSLRRLSYELDLQKQLLEQRVVERTAEQAKTLEELKHTQLQLVQHEKMSSLGQLVAGVAHEINNPVNFISGNLVHADNYIKDMLQILSLYQQRYPTPSPEIREFAENIDLNFLIEDLPPLLSSMRVGAERIHKIILSLRNFSRKDEAEFKSADIHEGIDSTLLILQHRLKARFDRQEINLIREYGALPSIECYAGQLNQVFMNIIANAIETIEDKLSLDGQSLQDPTISIRTETITEGETVKKVVIRIADNGMGMTEEVREKLFDPFFTTKPVGKGTGIGLSISYQIVTEQHGGTLECISTLGKGSEFIITIPTQHNGGVS